MELNRREWLGVNAAASVWGAELADWYDRPMRWAQLAFVEDDPGRYDPKFWLDYFQRVHADAACLSAGGCVAFYPTRIPLHYRSKFLGGADPFGEMVAGCRKLGMNVIARVDPHAVHQDVFDAHPDWIAVGADGKPRRHWAAAHLWVTCALGPYNFEFMPKIVAEIMEMYKVDGIFANRWSGSGMCYCEHCKKNFRAFSGLDLPRGNNDGANKQYAVWRNNRLFEQYTLWEAEVKKRNRRAAYFPNGYSTIRDRAAVPILIDDFQARSNNALPWANGRAAKRARLAMGAGPIVGIFSVGLEAPYRWKDSVQNPNEVLMWAAAGIAQGFRPWWTKFNAKPLDHRWFKPVEELFVWHWKNEKYMRHEKPLASVALVDGKDDHANGFYHAMVEARIPFELADAAALDKCKAKVLVLANVADLSAQQCAQLQAFVESGGGLVATHETSLNDEHGRRRADFGLADLFGASFAGNVIARQQNAYLDLEDRAHPLLAGLQDAGRMIHGVKRVEIRTAAGLRAPLMTVPTYPDLPMEEVYLRETKTDIPGVLLRKVGKGRVVYFPWDIDRTFWELLNQDHGIVMANAVKWAAGEPQPLEVKGPGVVDVAVWKQRTSMTVHMVNMSNPMMMRGPIREFLPVGPQHVRVRLPQGGQAREVKFLVSPARAQWRRQGEWIETTTPPIALHEVVAIDY